MAPEVVGFATASAANRSAKIVGPEWLWAERQCSVLLRAASRALPFSQFDRIVERRTPGHRQRPPTANRRGSPASAAGRTHGHGLRSFHGGRLLLIVAMTRADLRCRASGGLELRQCCSAQLPSSRSNIDAEPYDAVTIVYWIDAPKCEQGLALMTTSALAPCMASISRRAARRA